MAVRFYEGVECYRCRADFYDILTRGKNAAISCAFCGAAQIADYIAPPPSDSPTSASTFRFKFGSFAGMSMAEVAEQPNGEQYLRLQSRQGGKIKPIVDAFFAARGVSKNLPLPTGGGLVPLLAE
jgi:hypothetical protein